MCFEYLAPKQTCDHHVELLPYSKTKGIITTFSKSICIYIYIYSTKITRNNITEKVQYTVAECDDVIQDKVSEILQTSQMPFRNFSVPQTSRQPQRPTP